MVSTCEIVGGYLTTFEEVASCARQLGLQWHPSPDATQGGRKALNRWMIDQDPVLWYFRLEPIAIEKQGETITQLIIPTVGSVDANVDANFKFSQDEGTTANFKERARMAKVPEQLLQNFVTISKPDISVVEEPYGRPKKFIRLGSQLWLDTHHLD